MILKKKSCKRLSEEKNCMQHKWRRKKTFLHGSNEEKREMKRRKIMLQNIGKGKNILHTGFLEKKISCWPEITSPPQKLNGRLLKHSRFVLLIFIALMPQSAKKSTLKAKLQKGLISSLFISFVLFCQLNFKTQYG